MKPSSICQVALLLMTCTACGPGASSRNTIYPGKGAAGAAAAADAQKTAIRSLGIRANFSRSGQDPIGGWSDVVGQIFYGRPLPGENAIISEGNGGACIVVRQRQTCDLAIECSKPADGYAYCLDKKAQFNGGPVRGQCWVKGPDDQFCMKSFKALKNVSDGKMVAGTSYNIPLTGAATIRRPATVKIITCLNPPQDSWPHDKDGKPVAPCSIETPDALLTYGPPLQVH